MSYSQIRGTFIRSYSERYDKYLDRSFDLIEKRDDEHRALNKTYGYLEKDGTVSTGCKSHVDIDYKQKYDGVETRFRAHYDNSLPDLYDWCRREGMSIFEYLWIDNISNEHLKSVAVESARKPDWEMNFVGRKAKLFVDRLKTEHSVGEIRHLIDVEMQDHGYAATRCRKLLEIKTWEIGKQKVLFDYRRDWKAALEKAFGSLIAR